MNRSPDPDQGEALRMRAWQLQSSGRLAEAANAYRQLLEHHPDDHEGWNNLGNVLRALRDPEGAVAALERAVALKPGLPMIRVNLAGVLTESGRLEPALAVLQQAAIDAPDDLHVLVELGRAFSRLGRSADALVPVERAATLLPDHPAMRVELGLALGACGRSAEAEAAYRDAIRLDPAFAAAWLYLGLLLEHANRSDELGDMLDQARAGGVADGDLALIRAYHLRRQGEYEAAMEAARQSPPTLEPQRRAQLIGDCADRLGRTEEAFRAFTEMNRIAAATYHRAGERASAYRAEVESLLASTHQDFVARWRGGNGPEPADRPIFLMGFPRSGTTLLDTFLMGHPALHVIEEQPLLQRVVERMGGHFRLPEMDEAEIEALRSLYFEAVDRLAPPPEGRRIVDKMPLNIARLPILHRLFPGAPILFALRHPCDVVLSCYITAFSLNPAMANFLDLENTARLYDRIMTFGERCRALFPLRVHEIRYEALVADPEGEMRAALGFAGLPWEPALLDHRRAARERGYVASASYAQVTEPIYRRSAGRWTRYRAQMEKVLPLLAPWAEKWGYEI